MIISSRIGDWFNGLSNNIIENSLKNSIGLTKDVLFWNGFPFNHSIQMSFDFQVS